MAQLLVRAENVVDGDTGALEEVALPDDLSGFPQIIDGEEDADPATPLVRRLPGRGHRGKPQGFHKNGVLNQSCQRTSQLLK